MLRLPGKPVAHNCGLLSMDALGYSGLYSFGLLGFPATYSVP